jgi:hypothetical protein
MKGKFKQAHILDIFLSVILLFICTDWVAVFPLVTEQLYMYFLFSQIDEKLRPELKTSVKVYYKGDHAMDAISVLWNAIMLKVSTVVVLANTRIPRIRCCKEHFNPVT